MATPTRQLQPPANTTGGQTENRTSTYQSAKTVRTTGTTAERLACDAASLTETGNAFDDTDDPDEFDQWESDVDELVGTSRDFLRWSGVNELGTITELEEVKDSAERPQERESEGDYREERQVSGPYWTIDRMFEDL